MYEILKSLTFCYGHRLLEHQGKCANLHGHTARVDITLASDTLDELGMVMDFSAVKSALKHWIDENLDHTMLLCKSDPMVQILRESGERLYVMDDNPTAENIAKAIYRQAQKANLPVVSVTLWESDTSYARYYEAQN